MLFKLFHKIEKEGMLPNLFLLNLQYPMTKPDKNKTTHKKTILD